MQALVSSHVSSRLYQSCVHTCTADGREETPTCLKEICMGQSYSTTILAVGIGSQGIHEHGPKELRRVQMV